MPNTRRRRFSVQNEISGRKPTKIQTDQSSGTDTNSDLKITVNNVRTKSSKSKKKTNNTFKNVPSLEVVAECDSNTSLTNEKHSITSIENKDAMITSSNIEIENIPSAGFEILQKQFQETVNQSLEQEIKKDPRQLPRERTSSRRDRHPRQHRIKVRSPKRKLPILEQSKPDVAHNLDDKQTIGSDAINWEEEFETCIDTTCLAQRAENEERQSTHSTDDMCRICHGGDSLTSDLGCLISACSCRGTVGRVHVKCLERWLTESGKSRCELCGIRYVTRRVHKYGVLKALVMWILSQNAKQLMVDSLGIMLMSPLAVLAAWLSGRTLAGLMTQDSQITPWPLASTFVLACMTLVCYYCWIVSAATRHALGWWIWYRSQYEVRLELQEDEE